MTDLTSRELAWLRSIEPPARRCARAPGAPAIDETHACLAAARSTLTETRRLLADTSPGDAAWKRYLGA